MRSSYVIVLHNYYVILIRDYYVIVQRNKHCNNKSVLSPTDRLQIICIWENQTKNCPITKASIARTFGVTEGAIRQLLKRKDYWKNFVGLDVNSPVPTNLFSGQGLQTLQSTLNTSVVPASGQSAEPTQKAEITEEPIKDDEIIDQSKTIPDFELTL